VDNSLKALKLLAEINNKIHLSLLNQYYPLYNAKNYPEINQEVSEEDFERVHNYALELGFENGWAQTGKSSQAFVPDFTRENPFA